MKILKEMETGYGTGKWILADMGDEFYGYGTPTDFKSIYITRLSAKDTNAS